MILTREVESLEARCRRATAHNMTVWSAVVAVVQSAGRGGAPAWRVAVPIDVLIEVQLFTTRLLEDDPG